MAINVREYSDHYAYDLSKNVLSVGEVWDDKAISQSIEMILATALNERLFNPFFGSNLSTHIFEHINEQTGEAVLDDLIAAIGKWEDRVIVISKSCSMQILNDEMTIILTIPYVIKKYNITTSFKKKISF